MDDLSCSWPDQRMPVMISPCSGCASSEKFSGLAKATQPIKNSAKLAHRARVRSSRQAAQAARESDAPFWPSWALHTHAQSHSWICIIKNLSKIKGKMRGWKKQKEQAGMLDEWWKHWLPSLGLEFRPQAPHGGREGSTPDRCHVFPTCATARVPNTVNQ